MHPCGEEPGMGKCGAACHSHVIAQGGLRAARGFSGLTALLAFKSNKGAGAKSRPEVSHPKPQYHRFPSAGLTIRI